LGAVLIYVLSIVTIFFKKPHLVQEEGGHGVALKVLFSTNFNAIDNFSTYPLQKEKDGCMKSNKDLVSSEILPGVD